MRTPGSRRINWTSISAAVVDLPVPGGPWISSASPSSRPSASETARAWLRFRKTAEFTKCVGRTACGVGMDDGVATSRTRFGRLPVGLASSSSSARFCSRIFLRERGRMKPPERGGSDDVRTPTDRACPCRMRDDDARGRARAALIVEDLEPFAVVELTQRLGWNTFETPDVFVAAVRRARPRRSGRSGAAVRASSSAASASRAARRGSTKPPQRWPARRANWRSSRVDARGRAARLPPPRAAAGYARAATTTPTAPGSRSGARASSVTWATLTAISRPSPRVQMNSRWSCGKRSDKPSPVAQRAGVVHTTRVSAARVLTETSEAGFDRSRSKATHVVRLAVEPHPGGKRRAHVRRQFEPQRWDGFGEPATDAGPSEPSATTVGWHVPPVTRPGSTSDPRLRRATPPLWSDLLQKAANQRQRRALVRILVGPIIPASIAGEPDFRAR